MLRNFSWSYFASTGDIHAYLLYREHPECQSMDEEELDDAQMKLGESNTCL
ncbi:YqzL family protein [Brevibacillus dissolubilis]|uniref:YqzL family protein n=1 Tax=Brevibacillus dissolubilis TaxID=1844116 RepID=UPI0011174A07|nr:YqzL family protein [Brevibacillus dissolubilis]